MKNRFFQDLLSRCITWGYKGLQGVLKSYKGFQEGKGDTSFSIARTFFQLSFFSTEYDVLESSDFH